MTTAEGIRLAEMLAKLIETAIETYRKAHDGKITPGEAEKTLATGLKNIAANDAAALAALKKKFGKL